MPNTLTPKIRRQHSSRRVRVIDKGFVPIKPGKYFQYNPLDNIFLNYIGIFKNRRRFALTAEEFLNEIRGGTKQLLPF